LRYRVASSEEVHFIKTLDIKKNGVFATEAFLPPAISTVPKPTEGGTTSAQIQIADNILERAMQPSEEWIEVGSGTLGRVYMEVIGCQDLPNLDAPTIRNRNNMTDAFCCLIMEDSIVNTSVISDSLFPRWLPNDRRAFVFHVHHPSSHMYIGVFDHDKINRLGNVVRHQIHDPIGRVLVNISQLRPGVMYTLHYRLYSADNELDQNTAKQMHDGTLIVRLRIEWDGNRRGNDTMNMLIQGMTTPPESHLAVPHRPDFHVAHYTIVGMVSAAMALTYTCFFLKSNWYERSTLLLHIFDLQ
jgi:C2 domain